jgi:hypothetical protein
MAMSLLLMNSISSLHHSARVQARKVAQQPLRVFRIHLDT